jgi:small subunit ribosomal protein S18
MQPKRFQRRKFCRFCADKTSFIDYKDIKVLRGYMTERGKILSRKVTGNCSVHQRELTTAVKRARNIALIPFMER